ncbi:nucleotidyltransferase domain-containing protein [Aliinostoc sp. HNIBRCY26]|uniref:nucleotidyltransferase domain-containing protein n=1 Tax=Aliinostoc sp. HNIBRCY26 TaxID=3418997 RepID=UPI003D0236EE
MITLPQIFAYTQPFSTTKEVELLVYCANTKIDPQTVVKIQQLVTTETDWHYLIKIATWHRVQTLLYTNLKEICPNQVPPNIWEDLHSHCQKITLNNLFLTHKLVNILQLLAKNHIHAIPFKGSVLAVSAYGNLALRKFSDLDILVQKKDIHRTIEILESQNYQSKAYLTEARQELQEVFCEYSLLSADGRVLIDLHWELTPTYFAFKPNFDALWNRLQPISLAGQNILQLSLEDSLLYLCVHGCKDLWQRLAWICDVAELIKLHPEIAWKKLLEQAQKQDCERMLLLGLFLAADIQKLQLPEIIQQRIAQNSIIHTLATEVKTRLWMHIDEPLDVFERSFWSWRLAFHFRVMESWRHKILLCLFVLRFAITPKDQDYVALPLPNYLAGLYYMIRPVRLIIKFGLTPLKRGLDLCASWLSDRP